jgi:hypothetical protein
VIHRLTAANANNPNHKAVRADGLPAVRGPQSDPRPCFFGALVAEHDGPTMFTPMGVMRAVSRHVRRVFDPSRKDKRWGRRKLTRDQ